MNTVNVMANIEEDKDSIGAVDFQEFGDEDAIVDNAN